MNDWPADWDERMRGKGCPMCAEGRPEIGHGGSARIFEGAQSDGYLVRVEVGQRGYAVVIWRGVHVSDPTQLSDADAATYFGEVLRVARAIEDHYRPIKMNIEILGNSVPHLHTHVIPRYRDDGSAGHPARFMRGHAVPDTPIAEREYAEEVAALRALLGQNSA